MDGKAAAEQYRDDFLESASNLGLDTGLSGSHAWSRLPKSNTSGILGVNRTTSRMPSGTLYQAWQTTYITPECHIKTRKFSVNRLGELGALVSTVEVRKAAMAVLYEVQPNALHKMQLQKLMEKYDEIIDYLKSLSDADEAFLFLSMINNPDIANTSKQQMMDARIGQNRFRKLVLDRWGHQCAVTGATFFIVASHIKPWSVSDDNERMDINNGIALSPNYDHAFDRGYISFNNDGSIIISPDFGEDARRLGIENRVRIESFNFLGEKYLEYHRRNILRKGRP
jgi:putative restriction endonuclease